MCIVANIMLGIFQVDILWCNIEILRRNIEILWCDIEILRWNIEILRCNIEILRWNIEILRCNIEILRCNVEILRCNIESADVPDVHSGQYHAWVAFVPCIQFKPTQKVGLAWNQIKKSAEIKTK